ncbi:SET_domain [Hexamita inflata]|uniref:SET domain n=1 Tax=Hexamita inflata TaxID=28002 RepID=A0AA86UE10_9EUKA|nr:SET domain [Hexamita inflata]
MFTCLPSLETAFCKKDAFRPNSPTCRGISQKSNDYYSNIYHDANQQIQNFDKVVMRNVIKMQQPQTLNIDIIKHLTENDMKDCTLDDFSKLEYNTTNLICNQINNDNVYVTESVYSILQKWKSNASTRAIVMPTQCLDGDCDEGSDNWKTHSPLHRECKVDIEQKNLISTCTNHLITSLMYNNQINFQGQYIKIQNSLNKYNGKGAYSRTLLSSGQVLAVYYGVYSLKSQKLFETGYSAEIKVCPALQSVIDEVSAYSKDQIIINSKWNHSLAKYFNSSCFSQCCHFIQTFVQGIPYIAIALNQDVSKNTELYIDYGEDMLQIFGVCNCQQYNCRNPKYKYIMQIDDMQYIEQMLEFNLFYLSKLQNIVSNTYQQNNSKQRIITTDLVMKLMYQMQRISIGSNQINIYNQERYDLQHQKIKLIQKSNAFSSKQQVKQANLYKLEQDCIKEKQQIIYKLKYVVLPFRLVQDKFYDINENKLAVYLINYPNSRCFKKYNTVEYSLLFNILTLKCQIKTPYMYTYKTISSQQFLINIVRFVKTSITECKLIVHYFYDTVITQCINQYLNQLASPNYLKLEFLKMQSRNSYNHKLIEPIYIQAFIQAQQLVQQLIQPAIFEKIQGYDPEKYSKDEYICSLLQHKNYQSEVQQKWSYLGLNTYLNDFDLNVQYLNIIEFFVKNPLQQNIVIDELTKIHDMNQISNVITEAEKRIKKCR